MGKHSRTLKCEVDKMAAFAKPMTFASFVNKNLFKNAQPCICLLPNVSIQRRGYPTSKHLNPKFKKERGAKFLKVDLPKFVQLKNEREKPRDERSPDEIRMEMKKEGRLPPRQHMALPINISCTRQIMDPYKPKKGDGRHSDLVASGLADYGGKGKAAVRNLKDTRTLKKHEDFVEAEFASNTQRILIETNTLLQDVMQNQERLHELVTEEAFPELVHGLEKASLRWSFVESVEPPKVVQVRVEELMSKENLFAQVTVRMHTKQILAIYDRFGRLMYGDSQLPKGVVEYIVMEKWITDTNGLWRIHGKIMPEDAPPRAEMIKTYKVPVFEPIDTSSEESNVDVIESISDNNEGGRATPALA